MRVVNLVLASLALVANLAAASEQQWHVLGVGRIAAYEVLKSSVVTDKDTASRQFTLRTTLKAPMNGPNGTKIHVIVENVLTLCRENMFITTAQLQYNEKNELLNTSVSAVVYQNPQVPGDPVSQIMEFMCGRKTIDQRKKDLVEI